MATFNRCIPALLVMLAAGQLIACAKAPVATTPSVVAASGVEAERAYGIETVMGIGPVFGDKLRSAGITNTKKLMAATSSRYQRHRLADQADIPYKLVLQWAQKVALMKVDGIGPRQSNLLAAVGVESINELARRDPDNLTERVGVANAFEPHFVDGNPSLKTVTRWVNEAKKVAKDIDSED